MRLVLTNNSIRNIVLEAMPVAWVLLSVLLSIPTNSLANGVTRTNLVSDCADQGRGSRICIGERSYLLAYKRHEHAVTLKVGNKEKVLHRIDSRFAPEVVGSGQAIAFLPARLQLYGVQHILLYTVAQRSTGGDGRGQCGAGQELFLHALDVSGKTPKALSSVLIGSCKKDIYLYDSDSNLENFSITHGTLAIKFMNYPGQDVSPAIGVLSINPRGSNVPSNKGG
jgi:hypothetical protein